MDPEEDQLILDPLSVPPEFVKEGTDWFAVFNPTVQRVMDVDLAHKFTHDNVICSVKISSDSNLIAAGSDAVAIVYNLSAGTKTTFSLVPINDKPRARNYARAIVFDPHHKYLFVGSEDKLIRVWTLESGQLVRTLQGHRREIYALECSADGRTLVSASGDRTIRLWDMATILDPNTEPTHRLLVPPEGHNKSNVAFTSVAIAEYAGREYVASGSLDGGVRVWDATPGGPCEVVQILSEHADSVYGVKFIFGLRSGLGIVTGSLDKTLKKWELDVSGENGETACVKTFKGHKDAVLATSAVREGQNYRAASASKDGTVRLWDLKAGAALFVIHGHKNTVTAVDLSTDGKWLVSGSGDREIRIWRYTII